MGRRWLRRNRKRKENRFMIEDNLNRTHCVDGIPLSCDYRVQVNGASAPVYIMPTRYDMPCPNGPPMPVYDLSLIHI